MFRVLEIRDATLSDAPAMGKLMVDTWLDAHRFQMPEHLWEARRRDWTAEVSERGWRRTIEAIADGSSPHDAVLVACDAGRIVGIASCTVFRERAAVSVSALYVLKAYQRNGAGRQLLGAVVSRFTALGLATMEIAVLKANLPARRFYESMGGALAGERAFDEGGEMLPEVVYRWSLSGKSRISEP
jgi:ribosomal protein S18 acetylase RimI-like enzyme